jgi:probable phosphoglycerate mutase
MGWPRLLVLVRHGESVGNIKTAEQRATFETSTQDYPLTENGRRQAELTGEWLRSSFDRFDVYYHSYYRRAKETMQILYPSAKHYEDDRLAEANRGIWHSYTRDEIRQFFPKEIDRKEKEGLYHHRPIGGENWPDVALRLHSFLGTLARDCDQRRVLIVDHGHVRILLQKLIHRFSIDEALRRYHTSIVSNCSTAIYTSNSGRSLQLKGEGLVAWREEKGKIVSSELPLANPWAVGWMRDNDPNPEKTS